MTGRQERRIVKAARREARRPRGHFAQRSPWIVAGALAATGAIARVEVSARTVDASRNAASSPADAQPATRIEIPGGPLGDVLAVFEKVTGIRVEVAVEAMKVIYSPGASGALTERQALQQILEGTSISYRFSNDVTALLEFRTAAESVSVTATASVMSSPKFTAPLRDVPQTINVLKADLLAQQGAATLRDALRNVTGITFQAGEGGTPAGDQMTIRGFSARTDMFVDGVRDSGGYSRDTFNLEQVEVAKGPSSAIAGRGSTGGSINLVSKSPRLTNEVSATLEGGSADYKRGTVDLNHPITGIEGGAFRVNAMWNDSGVAGRDVAHDQRWAVAPSVAFGLRTPTRVTLSFLHMAQDNTPDYGLPWVPVTNVPLADYANGRAPARSENYYGLANRDYERIGNDIATGQVEHTFAAGANLRNVTRVGATDRDSIITSPRFAATDSTDIRRTDMKSRDQVDSIIANQTTLALRFKTGGITHDAVGGIEASREGSRNFARIEVGPETPVSPDTDLFQPNPYQRYTGQIVRTGAYTDATANSLAGYAFDTLHLGSAWQLTGGLRWDRFAVDYDSVSTTGASALLERTDRMVSGRAGVVYKPQEAASLYAGYATAFNPSAEGLALSTSTVSLEPEKTRSYEAGTKWDLRGERLSLTGALFRTEKRNARTPGINPGDPPTVLAGRQVVNGIELGVSGQVTSRWNGFAGYSFMHSDIARSNTAAEEDRSLALTPRHTFSVWTTLALTRKLTLGGGGQFMDAVFRNTTTTVVVPSYWMTNALVEYEVNDHLTLRMNGNNLGDADYVDRVSGGHYVPGPRRTLLLGTSVGF
jgi:catecholate siderophore receptor